MTQNTENQLWETENFKEGKVLSFKLQASRVTGTQTLQYDDGSHSALVNEDGHIF